MKSILVIAPHPDDETLGVGGTLLRHRAEKSKIHWLLLTEMKKDRFSAEQIRTRSREINKVAQAYHFDSVHCLKHPASALDRIPVSELVEGIAQVFRTVKPNMVYLPFYGDIHTDHKIAFEASLACTKWFRFPTVKKIAVYETLSETDVIAKQSTGVFSPNLFVDISSFLSKKLEIAKIYKSEYGKFPFPRSRKAIESLAALRGAAAGYHAAEAFMVLKERI